MSILITSDSFREWMETMSVSKWQLEAKNTKTIHNHDRKQKPTHKHYKATSNSLFSPLLEWEYVCSRPCFASRWTGHHSKRKRLAKGLWNNGFAREACFARSLFDAGCAVWHVWVFSFTAFLEFGELDWERRFWSWRFTPGAFCRLKLQESSLKKLYAQLRRFWTKQKILTKKETIASCSSIYVYIKRNNLYTILQSLPSNARTWGFDSYPTFTWVQLRSVVSWTSCFIEEFFFEVPFRCIFMLLIVW